MALGWLPWRAWAGVAGVVAADLLTHNLPTLTHTQLVHTQLVHTYSHTTCPHRPCSQLVHLHLAGLVLGDIDLHFAGQAWHVWHSAVSGARLGRSGRGGRRGCWRGRRGPLRHPPSFHVAGVVLGDIDLHFVWQPWHVCHTRLSSLIFESCSTNCVAQ